TDAPDFGEKLTIFHRASDKRETKLLETMGGAVGLAGLTNSEGCRLDLTYKDTPQEERLIDLKLEGFAGILTFTIDPFFFANKGARGDAWYSLDPLTQPNG